jgi:phosphoribosylamine--glycine ligase
MSDIVIGSGGREHAICWALGKEGRSVECAPGNAGMAHALLAVSANDFDGLVKLARKAGGLTIVGPEVPLVNGIADRFIAEGLPILGPSAKAARTEGSKAWFKRLLHKYDIPTAPFQIYDYAKLPLAFTEGGFIKKRGVENVVVKASGLYAGKGVILPKTEEDIYRHCAAIRADSPAAIDEIVIEEREKGPECSLIGLNDGVTEGFFPTAQDYKAASAEDARNTGGMGAYTAAIDPEVLAQCRAASRRINDALRAESIMYRGFFYDGYLLTEKGPKVCERNCRFGDPETEAILPSLGPGFAAACTAAAKGDLASVPMPTKARESVAVVLASRAYPEPSSVDAPVNGIEQAKEWGALIFHAGTKRGNAGFTTGKSGRVLVVTGTGTIVEEARKTAYGAAGEILRRTPELRCRTDIAV